jgi:hypothetical protein
LRASTSTKTSSVRRRVTISISPTGLFQSPRRCGILSRRAASQRGFRRKAPFGTRPVFRDRFLSPDSIASPARENYAPSCSSFVSSSARR